MQAVQPVKPIEALSPIIIAQLRHPENPTSAERARVRGRVTKQVRECTACELHKQCSGPVPFRGSPRARIAIVGEAPGPDEDARGMPFVGASGKLLNVLLSEAGFDPDDDVFYANTVSCFPNTEGKIHAPNPNETLACRRNLLDQLAAAYLPVVVLVGGKALSAFRSDLTVTNHHGGVFVWLDQYIVVPTYHPAYALRGSSAAKGWIRDDLRRVASILDSGDSPLSFIGDTCYKCPQEATWWDRDAVPMCDAHWKKWGKSWEQERYRWTGDPIIQLTL